MSIISLQELREEFKKRGVEDQDMEGKLQWFVALARATEYDFHESTLKEIGRVLMFGIPPLPTPEEWFDEIGQDGDELGNVEHMVEEFFRE